MRPSAPEEIAETPFAKIITPPEYRIYTAVKQTAPGTRVRSLFIHDPRVIVPDDEVTIRALYDWMMSVPGNRLRPVTAAGVAYLAQRRDGASLGVTN